MQVLRTAYYWGMGSSRSKRRGNRRIKFSSIALAFLAVCTVAVVAFAFRPVSQPAPTMAATSPQPTKSAPPVTVALWAGDSFTAGVGAGGTGYSYPNLVAIAMGWVNKIDAESGTGFVADGKNNAETNTPLPARLDRFSGNPQYVILDAGRNDWQANFETQTTPAVRGYLDAIQKKWPEAKIVLIVPFNVTSTAASPKFVKLFTEEAERVGGAVINPVGEGWVNKGIMASMTFSDEVHPNKAGHEHVAKHLVERLKELGIMPAPVG